MSHGIHSLRAETGQAIRSPSEAEAALRNVSCYLTVLEDNKKASRFLPDDASLALDMAQFVCNRIQGKNDSVFIPTMRLSISQLAAGL